VQRRHQSPVRVGVAKGRHRLLRSREEGRAVSLSLLERSCAYVLVRKASGRGHSLFSKSCFAHFETRPAARRGAGPPSENRPADRQRTPSLRPKLVGSGSDDVDACLRGQPCSTDACGAEGG
jgi:hypothetical protein